MVKYLQTRSHTHTNLWHRETDVYLRCGVATVLKKKKLNETKLGGLITNLKTGTDR